MNTINLTIPASFSPDTLFAIPMQTISESNEPDKESLSPRRYFRASEEELTRRGIPDSALHD